MSNKKNPPNKRDRNTLQNHHDYQILVAIIGAIALIMAALLNYISQKYTVDRPLHETQTAAVKSITTVSMTTVASAEGQAILMATMPACPLPRQSKIGGDNIISTVSIIQPTGECSIVSRNETIKLDWSIKPAETYFLWILVFSPITKQYYPRACDINPLPGEGTIQCMVTFGKAEPYEIVIILADQAANTELGRQTEFSESTLPDRIEEKAALSVYGSP